MVSLKPQLKKWRWWGDKIEFMCSFLGLETKMPPKWLATKATSTTFPFEKVMTTWSAVWDFCLMILFSISRCYFIPLHPFGGYTLLWKYSSVRSSTKPQRAKGRRSKYPAIQHTYESVTIPGLYFAGTVTHSLDYRKSAGGFIHGFRYTGKSYSGEYSQKENSGQQRPFGLRRCGTQ